MALPLYVSSQPFGAATDPDLCEVIIRHLPAGTTETQLRLLTLFSPPEELQYVEILDDQGTHNGRDNARPSALLIFSTLAGAQHAKDMLHGKSIDDAELSVEIIQPQTHASQLDGLALMNTSNGSATITSPGGPSRMPPRHVENSIYGFSNHRDHDYYEIFSPQSPITNQLANQTNSSGRDLIHETAEDEETRELLNDPLRYAENGATQHRRATAPQLHTGRMTNLSLITSSNGHNSIASYPHANMTPVSAQGHGRSPTLVNGASMNNSLPYAGNGYSARHIPPSNPADQNPPCNTLYVGNLPVDTSEEELKAIFQKQRGYKRLCLRTKQNGPMCFVEFEDITCATRALNECYGKLLHNSIKGGIRLSFSKNPLGVRSGQPALAPPNGSMSNMNGLISPSPNNYPIPNRPPPGLTTPPGFSRHEYNGNAPTGPPNGATTSSGYSNNNGRAWNVSVPQYQNHHAAGNPASPPNGPTPAYPPHHYGA
ncbi:hypothetical protein F4808DRAFT_459488 [Astrocystis sublimbata]|nr:hypothetical protein F4808DRAFT_459488 [Astrocystis sublimbata]